MLHGDAHGKTCEEFRGSADEAVCGAVFGDVRDDAHGKVPKNAGESACDAACEETCDDARLARLLPHPATDANKYTRGTLTLVAGSAAYPGAACLAAAAAQRMGAGYTQVVTASENVRTVQAFRPSLVVRSWESWDAAAQRAFKADKPCAYVVGSGFEEADEHAAELAFSVLGCVQAPVLVDGGAFAALASERGLKVLRRRFLRGLPTVLTPHGGEAARLAAAFGVEPAVPEAGRGRGAFALDLARACGATVVLKGPDTCIAQPAGAADAGVVGVAEVADAAAQVAVPAAETDALAERDRFLVMRDGTPALAKAGTGDVLAGMVGSLLAQGLGAFDASVLGSVLHARAGRLAEGRLGDICVISEDVLEALPEAVGNLAASL